MRTHMGTAGIFLRAVTDCLENDSISMIGWSCLHMPGLLSDCDTKQRMAIMEASFQPLDGALVVGAAGDLLIFYRGMAGAGQGRLQQEIQDYLELPELPGGRVYDLANEWLAAETLFLSQMGQLKGRVQLSYQQTFAPQEDEGIRHMAEVLNSSKFSRQYRSPMTVLLVEDDPVTRQMAGKLIGQQHVLVTASNAYEAVVNYLIYAPELVFLDINLPDESGMQVLDQLMACDPDAYIVMFSGNDGIDNIVDARKRGARGFVSKPFKRDRIKHFMHEREEMSERQRREMQM